MNTQLQDARAQRINELHQTVLSSINGASEHINAAMMASVEIGGHIGEISRGQRMAWLRDNCPDITHKQIAAYLSISNTYSKRKNTAIDHRFFTLLGMTEQDQEGQQDEQDARESKPKSMQWMTWAGKVVGYFGEATKKYPTEQWMDCEKVAVAAQLKPIVELYNELTK